MSDYVREIDVANLWPTIQREIQQEANNTPLLNTFFQRNILDHANFEAALCHILAEKLADQQSAVLSWKNHLYSIVLSQQKPSSDIAGIKGKSIKEGALADLLCQLSGNASIKDHYSPLLFFAGYQALQCHRFAHYCWFNQQRALAGYIQAKTVSLFGIDIHPAAQIGSGIFMDHSVAVVIGETAVVEDDVTLFQSVTLGGTGKGSGDRHPKIRQGAFIGSGTVIYGNIEIGKNAKVAGGTVVVKDVAENTTVFGLTAKEKHSQC
ncbi:serine acetyltransferase [Psychromonas sp. MB-3u-54]|uniref:serine O-acetyltransferase n=1 Tax=Psychromonas sp. MB-3u-54 TaxID=2058319 RepID=UPI000C337BD7|nr:serine acetyltransferase [Psychromonas sp. MB-3u-54]PKH03794.1 serine acetyltransferase [Psychromonas sp. MB-3u-54]